MEQRTLTIAVVGDIHHGRNQGESASSQALDLLATVLAEMKDHGPDLLVELGGRINDTGRDADAQATREVGRCFDDWATPRLHVLGNHDSVNLTPSEIDRALGATTHSIRTTLGGWTVIAWSPLPTRDAEGRPCVRQSDIDWLDANIGETERAVVFTHCPLGRQDPRGNWYFHHHPERATYANLDDVLSVLDRKTGLVAVVAGHAHWNSLST